MRVRSCVAAALTILSLRGLPSHIYRRGCLLHSQTRAPNKSPMCRHPRDELPRPRAKRGAPMAAAVWENLACHARDDAEFLIRRIDRSMPRPWLLHGSSDRRSANRVSPGLLPARKEEHDRRTRVKGTGRGTWGSILRPLPHLCSKQSSSLPSVDFRVGQSLASEEEAQCVPYKPHMSSR
jgi:hypothetical protein